MVDGVEPLHPFDGYLKRDLIPSVWCSGCGIGTVVNTFVQTVAKLKIAPSSLHIVVGTGCTAKIAEYIQFGKPHVAPGNIFEHALATAQRYPDGTIVLIASDTDFIVSPPSDFFLKRNVFHNSTLFYINNYVYYTLVQHRGLSSTPFMGREIDSESNTPFNIPQMAQRAGAKYIARWTPLHVRRLMYSMTDALLHPDLSVIEVVSPCLIYYGSNGMAGQKIDRMQYLYDNTTIHNSEPIKNLDIRFSNKIIVGKFVAANADQ